MKNVFENTTIAVPTLSVKDDMFAIFDKAYAEGVNIFDAALGHHYSHKCISSYATYWRRARGISSPRKVRVAPQATNIYRAAA